MNQIRCVGDKLRNNIRFKIIFKAVDNFFIANVLLQGARDIFLPIHDSADFRFVESENFTVSVFQICRDNYRVEKIRADCRDIWNAFMARGAKFSERGIPFCPTTAKEIPCELISYTEARAIYNRRLKCGDKNFFVNAFIHFYRDDYKFDGSRCGIWAQPRRAQKFFGTTNSVARGNRKLFETGFEKLLEVLKIFSADIFTARTKREAEVQPRRSSKTEM